MELNKKTIRNIFLGTAACIFLYWVLHETDRLGALLRNISSLFAPFVAGAAMAFILNVPMRFFEKFLGGVKKPALRRGLALVITLLAVVLVLYGVVSLLIPQITETVESLISVLPGFFERLYNYGVDFLKQNPELDQWLRENTNFDSINWSEWIQKILGILSGGVTSFINTLMNAVLTLSNGIFNAVLSFVFGIYCLVRKEILARQGRRIIYSLLPEKVGDETIRILRMTNSTFSRFLSGQCLEAVILGCMFAVCMALFKMPFMPLVSVIIAVTALVPIVGAFIGCVLGAFFILVQDPVLAFWFVIMFLVLQQIEGNLIYPKVVGSSIGLPGMWVLVAVAVGGELMGIVGMFVMIPLASVVYTLLREVTDKRLTVLNVPREKLQDQPQEIVSRLKEKREKKKAHKLLKTLEKKEQADEVQGD